MNRYGEAEAAERVEREGAQFEAAVIIGKQKLKPVIEVGDAVLVVDDEPFDQDAVIDPGTAGERGGVGRCGEGALGHGGAFAEQRAEGAVVIPQQGAVIRQLQSEGAPGAVGAFQADGGPLLLDFPPVVLPEGGVEGGKSGLGAQCSQAGGAVDPGAVKGGVVYGARHAGCIVSGAGCRGGERGAQQREEGKYRPAKKSVFHGAQVFVL